MHEPLDRYLSGGFGRVQYETGQTLSLPLSLSITGISP